MSKQTKFTKITDWLKAGGSESGFYMLEKIERETDKAIGFKAEKYNAYGYLKPAVCWIAKSLLQEVENDFYKSGPSRMYLVPHWLYSRKTDEDNFVL